MSENNGNGNSNGSKFREGFNKLTTDVEVLKSLVHRLDDGVNKLADASLEVSKLINKHEARLDHAEKKDEMVNEEIHILHHRISETAEQIIKELKEVSNNLDKSSQTTLETIGNRLRDLEKWKWYAAGAIIAIAIGAEYKSIATILSKIF